MITPKMLRYTYLDMTSYLMQPMMMEGSGITAHELSQHQIDDFSIFRARGVFQAD